MMKPATTGFVNLPPARSWPSLLVAALLFSNGFTPSAIANSDTPGTCTIDIGSAAPGITPYISDEAGGGNNNTVRNAVEGLDDAWRTAVGQPTNPTVTNEDGWFGTTNNPQGSASGFTYLDPITGTSTAVIVELVRVAHAAPTDCQGEDFATPSGVGLFTGTSMQDNARRPNSLYVPSPTADRARFWNETSSAATDQKRYAIRFTFAQPVKSFGAWFGDVETSNDPNQGTPSILRLIDASGDRIGQDLDTTPTHISLNGTTSPLDQSLCGGSTGTDPIACGNQTTRWLGFVDSSAAARVSQMLVVVGDNDALPMENTGDTEHLSFIGFNIPSISSGPNLLLTKRITAINPGLTDEQRFDTSYIDVGTSDDHDNAVNWPGAATAATLGGGTVESYIAGITGIDDVTAVANTTVKPGDEIEYTIPFLSAGDATAQNVLICDPIPANTTFIANAFNASTPTWTGSGDRGIFLSFNSANIALTNADDGDEIADTGANDGIGGYYFPPGEEPRLTFPGLNCANPNNTGAVVVDLSNIPHATGEGSPVNSYGFIRFRVVVD